MGKWSKFYSMYFQPQLNPCFSLKFIYPWWRRKRNAMAEIYSCVHACCLILCYSMDCIPPGSSVHRILQARILEWDAMPCSFPTHGSQLWLWCFLLRLDGRHMSVHDKISLFLSPYVDIYVAFKCCIYMHIFIYATLKYNICIAFASWQTLF